MMLAATAARCAREKHGRDKARAAGASPTTSSCHNGATPGPRPAPERAPADHARRGAGSPRADGPGSRPLVRAGRARAERTLGGGP
jgi:hypothetical protein